MMSRCCQKGESDPNYPAAEESSLQQNDFVCDNTKIGLVTPGNLFIKKYFINPYAKFYLNSDLPTKLQVSCMIVLTLYARGGRFLTSSTVALNNLEQVRGIMPGRKAEKLDWTILSFTEACCHVSFLFQNCTREAKVQGAIKEDRDQSHPTFDHVGALLSSRPSVLKRSQPTSPQLYGIKTQNEGLFVTPNIENRHQKQDTKMEAPTLLNELYKRLGPVATQLSFAERAAVQRAPILHSTDKAQEGHKREAIPILPNPGVGNSVNLSSLEIKEANSGRHREKRNLLEYAVLDMKTPKRQRIHAFDPLSKRIHYDHSVNAFIGMKTCHCGESHGDPIPTQKDAVTTAAVPTARPPPSAKSRHFEVCFDMKEHHLNQHAKQGIGLSADHPGPVLVKGAVDAAKSDAASVVASILDDPQHMDMARKQSARRLPEISTHSISYDGEFFGNGAVGDHEGFIGEPGVRRL